MPQGIEAFIDIPTAVLVEQPLSWAVAAAEGLNPQLGGRDRDVPMIEIPNITQRHLEYGVGYKPTSYESLADGIIDREGIATFRDAVPPRGALRNLRPGTLWTAAIGIYQYADGTVDSPTGLQMKGTSRRLAAMRAWVAAATGPLVQVPRAVIEQSRALRLKAARAGDAAMEIAQRELGDSERWEEVIQHNPPDTFDSSWREAVLVRDTTLLLPKAPAAADGQDMADREHETPATGHQLGEQGAAQRQLAAMVAIPIALRAQLAGCDLSGLTHSYEISPWRTDPNHAGSVVLCDELDAEHWGLYRRPLSGPPLAEWIVDFNTKSAAQDALIFAYQFAREHPDQQSSFDPLLRGLRQRFVLEDDAADETATPTQRP